MKKLFVEVKNLMQSETGLKAKQRMQEFTEFKNHSNEKWFSELCFCLLTANTSAEMGLRVQKKINEKQFLELPEKQLAIKLKKAGSRFYNRRANFICSARKFSGIKKILSGLAKKEKRIFLVKNIKGIGLKEASHFLRNTGNFNYAIIDRHVWNVAKENNLIKQIPLICNEWFSYIVEFVTQVKCLAFNCAIKPCLICVKNHMPPVFDRWFLT